MFTELKRSAPILFGLDLRATRKRRCPIIQLAFAAAFLVTTVTTTTFATEVTILGSKFVTSKGVPQDLWLTPNNVILRGVGF